VGGLTDLWAGAAVESANRGCAVLTLVWLWGIWVFFLGDQGRAPMTSMPQIDTARPLHSVIGPNEEPSEMLP
jgi:hypothetical protein